MWYILRSGQESIIVQLNRYPIGGAIHSRWSGETRLYLPPHSYTVWGEHETFDKARDYCQKRLGLRVGTLQVPPDEDEDVE